MKQWLYKWLPIIFGCHGRDDRSFHFHGRKFPLCARCTGELCGILFSLCSYFFIRPKLPLVIIFMLPMLIDGFVQLKTSYESTNIRRFVTGLLFGYGLASLFVISTSETFLLGYHFHSNRI